MESVHNLAIKNFDGSNRDYLARTFPIFVHFEVDIDFLSHIIKLNKQVIQKGAKAPLSYDVQIIISAVNPLALAMGSVKPCYPAK